MATKKDLEYEVKRLNERYCKNTKNHLVIKQAFGGYSVMLTGKTYKRGKKTFWRKGSLGSGGVNVGNGYHDTATNTLNGLYKAEARGWLQKDIRYREKYR